MKDTLISFETAKLAKEKGFDEYCNNWFCKGNYLYNDNYQINNNSSIDNLIKYRKKLQEKKPEHDFSTDELCVAPTQSLLQKWLREIHKINVYCIPCQHDENLWYNNIASHDPVFTGKYEKALELGLYQALLLINP